MNMGLEPGGTSGIPENVSSTGGRPTDLPGRVCPRCGREYVKLEIRHSYRRDYVYAVHYDWVNGKRVRRTWYLGPKEGYKYGAAAHLEKPWFGAPLSAADPQLEFQRRLGYLGNLTRATLGVAEMLEDANAVIRVLEEELRIAERHAQLVRAAGSTGSAAAGGGT